MYPDITNQKASHIVNGSFEIYTKKPACRHWTNLNVQLLSSSIFPEGQDYSLYLPWASFLLVLSDVPEETHEYCTYLISSSASLLSKWRAFTRN
jgi:hypothetical protein